MSKESYVRGFCKAAEAAGVDPRELAKYAQSIIGAIPSAQDISSAKNSYRKAMNKAIGLGNRILNNIPYQFRGAMAAVDKLKDMSGKYSGSFAKSLPAEAIKWKNDRGRIVESYGRDPDQQFK